MSYSGFLFLTHIESSKEKLFRITFYLSNYALLQIYDHFVFIKKYASVDFRTTTLSFRYLPFSCSSNALMCPVCTMLLYFALWDCIKDPNPRKRIASLLKVSPCAELYYMTNVLLVVILLDAN